MKYLLSLLLFFQFVNAQNVQRIEPPNWWVGMEHNEIQILCYGDDISTLVPKLSGIDSEEVFITKTTRTENPNYLFIDLTINSNANRQS